MHPLVQPSPFQSSPVQHVTMLLSPPKTTAFTWVLAALACVGLPALLLVAWLTVTIGSPWYLVPAWAGVAVLVPWFDRFAGQLMERSSEPQRTRFSVLGGALWLIAWQVWLAIFAEGWPVRMLIALVCGVGTLWIPYFAAWRRVGLVKRLAAILVALGIALPAGISLQGLSGDGKLIFSPRISALRPSANEQPVHSATDSHPPEHLTAGPGPDEFSQLLGPNREGVLPEVVLTDWQPTPPRIIWRRPLGPAWSGMVGDVERCFTMEQRGNEEAVACLSTRSGESLWSAAYPAQLAGSAGGTGPRATPTLAAGNVYALGATGVLSCIDQQSGKVLWRHNVLDDHQAANREHGCTGSPLVTDGMVIVALPGGNDVCLAAYDLQSGAEIWTARGEPAAYSSPAVAEFGGVRQICLFHTNGLAGFDMKGRRLWDFPFGAKADNAAQPLFHAGGEDRILLTTGQGHGCVAIDLAKETHGDWAATEVWRKPLMKTKFSTAVVHQVFAYGLDNGILECLDVRTGALKWKAGRYGHGQLLACAGKLLLLDEQGTLRLLALDPAGLRELGKIPVLTGKTWNHFAVVGPLVLVRNSEEAAAVRLPGRGE